MKLFFELVRSVSAKQSPVLFEAFDTLVRRGFEVEYGIAQETMRPDLMVGQDHHVPVSHTGMTLRLGGLLDADGARLLEPYRFVYTRDEPFASPRLRAAGIPAPRSWVTGDLSVLYELLEESPLTVRPLRGDRGAGVQVLDNGRGGLDLEASEGPVLIQEYADDTGEELKVYIVNEDVFAVRKPFPETSFATPGRPCVPDVAPLIADYIEGYALGQRSLILPDISARNGSGARTQGAEGLPRLRQRFAAVRVHPVVVVGQRAQGPRRVTGPPAVNGDATELRAAPAKRIGQILHEMGAAHENDVLAAVDEQARTGGRLGDIMVARETVDPRALTRALASQLRLPVIQVDDKPQALLPADEAHRLRAIALENGHRNGGPPGCQEVAVADPRDDVLNALRRRIGRPIRLKLADEATLDAELARLYGPVEIDEATRQLREKSPQLSAYRTRLSTVQLVSASAIAVATVLGLVFNATLTAATWIGIATAFYLLSVGYRAYLAHQGWKSRAIPGPSDADIAGLDERALPTYTLLIPLYREKRVTLGELFESLSRLDYPKHKLDGVLLIEADDRETRDEIEAVGRPVWLRILEVPAGAPRTKPRALSYGLRYAKGSLLTVFDAEDQPDPGQLKQSVWSFEHGDASLACLQARLTYHNARQNLLTRWFTLEYDAWFGLFLPGLHRVGAAIPLGGTSNHFRADLLRECLGWDPYNVTEDADLGVRLRRLGLTTAMLNSTTNEEANSRLAGWLLQRSRWIKGFMQTLVVHTRQPLLLYRDLGAGGLLAFLLTIGWTVGTALISPLFWALIIAWVVAQPAWIAALFPAPIYYPSLLALVFGNFLLVLLSLWAAVGRGHDDLSPHVLLTPCYWVLNSIAGYMALVELIVRPYHWHKTEHGLHVSEPDSVGRLD